MANNTYLAHYGVKGMKWGVIREKLHSAGKKAGAYAVKAGKAVGKNMSTAVKNTATKHKPVSMMTSDELSDKIKRLKLEKEYSQLMNDVNEQKLIHKGMNVVKNGLANGLTKGIEYGTTNLISKAVDRFNSDLEDDRKTQSIHRNKLEGQKLDKINEEKLKTWETERKEEKIAKAEKAHDKRVRQGQRNLYIREQKTKLSETNTQIKRKLGKNTPEYWHKS